MSGERKGLYAEISERDFEFFKILCGERDACWHSVKDDSYGTPVRFPEQ